MKKIFKLAVMAVCGFMLLPGVSFASAVKTFSGSVIKIAGSQIIFSTTSAANYSADFGNATLVRKNGTPMLPTEILAGDKISVTGTLWPDNSISAAKIQDNSLYAHTGTFTGKITSINPSGSNFTIQSKTHGTQTIQTNTLTAFSQNGTNASFGSLGLGMTATVKGMWDRSNVNVLATTVDASFRMINIYFTGTLSIVNGNSITVIGNGNVIYGVDLTKATLENKSSQPINIPNLKIGDTLRVWGKHISGSVQIAGTKVKDSSISK